MVGPGELLAWTRASGLRCGLTWTVGVALALAASVWLAAPTTAAQDDTTLVSLATVVPGGKADAAVGDLDVSGDGRYVAFATQADNLVAADTEGDDDIYLRDTVLGTTTLVTPGDGVPGSGAQPAISDDGQTVAFIAYEDIDPNDTNGENDVYVADLSTGPPTLELVSRPTGPPGPGTPAAPEGAGSPAISGDGTVVGFVSDDNTLDPVNDTDTMGGAYYSQDAFVRELDTDTTELVSRGATDGNRASWAPALDDDGSHVSFDTQASNLEGADTDEDRDVYVRNRTAGTLTLASRADNVGAKGDDDSIGSSLDGDGSTVAFISQATNLDGDDGDSTHDVYIRDLDSDDTELISRASGPDGAKANKIAQDASISADGTEIAFISSASNLDPAYTTVGSVNHAYIRDLDDDSTRLHSRADTNSGAIADDGVRSGLEISANGRAIAFPSRSTNLDPDDTDTTTDAYMRDVASGDTRLASQAPFGSPVNANGISQDPSMSADGRYVAFSSDATNLDPDATNNRADIFVFDAETGTVELASRADGASGAEGDGNSHNPSISPDGRYVAFESDAENLDTDGDAEEDIFVRDLEADTTELVSLDDSDANIGGFPSSPSISEDGERVAFDASDDYHPDGNNGLSNIYVRDRTTGRTLMASRESNSPFVANDHSYMPDISDDGRVVAFESDADNLPSAGNPHGNPAFQQLFVHDLAAGTTELVSRADGAGGAAGNRDSWEPSISADGSRVAFHTDSDNLHPDDPTTDSSVFVRDLGDDETILASRASNGDPASASSEAGVISGDGTYIAFVSAANNLDSASDDTRPDVYHRDLITGTTKMASRAQGAAGAQGDDSDADPSISEHGRFVSFDSRSANLDPADDDSSSDVYQRDILGPDTNVPQTTITSGPVDGSFTSQAAHSFDFTVDDPLASSECQLDGAGFAACSDSFSTGELADGEHTFEVRSTDRAGNVESPAPSRTFTVDTVAPDTTIDGGPNGLGSDPTPSVTFSSTEPGATFECSLDGAGFSACTSPHGLGPLADGDHSFRVRSTDPAGNVDASAAEREFTIDTRIDGRKVKVRKKQRVKKRVKAKVTVRKGEAVSVKLAGSVTKGGGKLKQVSKDAADGKKAKLVAKLSKTRGDKKVRRKLNRGKKVKAKLTVRVTDDAGNTEKTKKTVKLK